MVSMLETMVFATGKMVFVIKKMVFAANTMVSGIGTMVWMKKTMVLKAGTTVTVAKKMVSVTKTIVGKDCTQAPIEGSIIIMLNSFLPTSPGFLIEEEHDVENTASIIFVCPCPRHNSYHW
jgi:hypothetical protein